jgi:hypothetical protein
LYTSGTSHLSGASPPCLVASPYSRFCDTPNQWTRLPRKHSEMLRRKNLLHSILILNEGAALQCAPMRKHGYGNWFPTNHNPNGVVQHRDTGSGCRAIGSTDQGRNPPRHPPPTALQPSASWTELTSDYDFWCYPIRQRDPCTAAVGSAFPSGNTQRLVATMFKFHLGLP